MKVYMCMSTDIIHSGHIAIINKAAKLGELTIGVLSDSAVASYKRYPLLPMRERMSMIENIKGVSAVVEQNSLSYKDNLLKYKPEIVVHGDNWASGFQKATRDEVIEILNSYGGKLVEFPYTHDEKLDEIEKRTRAELATPDVRRGRLKNHLAMTGFLTAMEAHDGLTGLIVEKTVIHQGGGAHQFDAMWISSLCDSTAKGKPDIELVDMTSRFRTIEDISEVTTKPIIFDADTGGLKEHFVYTVRSLERLGVSMAIIEDKVGLKKNSLFGTEVKQRQDTIEHFCEKIRAGKEAQRTSEFMICARCESLILEQGMEDALNRTHSYVKAGADAIMIHSRKTDPAEIIEYIKKFRETDKTTPIVLVPTSFNSITEEEWKEYGANIVIYANQLMRASVPAMQECALKILESHRAQEVDEMCMPFKEIIRLIPADY
jgi:phosphoenolpyruvate phosphomutase